MGAVFASGVVQLGEVNILGVHRPVADLLRDGALLALGYLSLRTTATTLRERNGFSWLPIREVAILFAAIFVTMIPVLEILKAGREGAFAFLIEAVREPVHYYWVAGLMSSFLDNAPTYLVFFNTALGNFYPGGEPRPSRPLRGRRGLPGGHRARGRLHGGQHLHRQRPQLHGPLHRGGVGRRHAELLRLHLQIFARSDPWFGGAPSYSSRSLRWGVIRPGLALVSALPSLR